MRESVRDADTDALRRSAHTVDGAALHLGLPAVADAAALLSREAGTLAAARALCTGEGLLRWLGWCGGPPRTVEDVHRNDRARCPGGRAERPVRPTRQVRRVRRVRQLPFDRQGNPGKNGGTEGASANAQTRPITRVISAGLAPPR